MTKPDGGRGWLEFFLAQGLTVYVPDLPFHGRSASVATPGANAVALRTDVIESHFTATARVDNPDWLSAKAHCQWPGASDASFLSLSLSLCVCVCVCVTGVVGPQLITYLSSGYSRLVTVETLLMIAGQFYSSVGGIAR